MNIRIKKLNPNAVIPTKGSDKAAGYDLYVCDDRLANGVAMAISPGQNALLKTGLAMAIPDGYYGAIYARSGLASKQNLRPANCVGVVDSDYRGEVMVALHNHSTVPQTVEHGERVAQMLITPVLTPDYEEASELSDTVRGVGGFGSTGK